jgi:DNA-binding MarR family transcriptional regulator
MTAPTKNTTTPTAAAVPMAAAVVEMAAVVVPDTARRRRQLTRAIKESLRELSNQLSLLNHHVGARIDLNDTDLDCLELVNRHGPLNPSALARHAGLHPATITGILDRLERGGLGRPRA